MKTLTKSAVIVLTTATLNVNAGQVQQSQQTIVNAWQQQNDTIKVNENSFNGATWNRLNVNNSQQDQISDSYNRVNVNSNNTTNSSTSDSYNSSNTANGGFSNADSNSYSEGSTSFSEGSESTSTSNAEVGDATANSGNNSISTGSTNVKYENTVMTYEAMQFDTAYDTIGSVSKARTTLRAEAGHSEQMGNMVRVGVNIPLTWGSNPTDDALAYEAELIRSNLIRQQEKHEMELKEANQLLAQNAVEFESHMFAMCMELHKLGGFTSKGANSALKAQCDQYVPHNDHYHNAHGHDSSSTRLTVSEHK